MGTIRETATGRTRLLESDNLIGRANGSLTLPEPYVSGVHAEIRWNGSIWELKDLGSRNGTFLDGRRIEPSVGCKITRGSRIGIGKTQQEWEMIDDSGPQIMALPLSGGDPVVLQGELVALPSSSDPRATIYRSIDGAWLLETPDDLPTQLTHGQVFHAVGAMWRFSCSELAPETIATSDAGTALGLLVSRLRLSFSVSRDEEFVQLKVASDRGEHDFGSRRHNYLLLTLARRRLEEHEAGVSEAGCGWIDVEELAHDPSMAPPQLNIDVYRIREQFAKEGVVDAAAIIERRPQPRQLRIGTGRITIATI